MRLLLRDFVLDVPNPALRDIASSYLLEVCPNLLNLASSSTSIIQQVTELARVGFDVGDIFLVFRVTLQDKDLMLWSHRLADGIHW